MNILTKYLKEVFLLIEGKLDDLKIKYQSISSDDIEQIYSADPSKSKKYSDWMAKQFSKGENLEKIISLIKNFNNKQNYLKVKDINQYKNLEELEIALLSSISKSSERKRAKKEGAKKIYEDNEVLVVRLDSKEACVLYGKGSKWCITQPKEPHYEIYSSGNVLFYFLLSKIYDDEKYSKIAFSVERKTGNEIINLVIWDARDKEIDKGILEELYENADEIVNVCTEDAKTQERSILFRIVSGAYERSDLEEFLKNADVESDFFLYSILPAIRNEDMDLVFDCITEDTPNLADAFIQLGKDEYMDGLLKKLGVDFIAMNYLDFSIKRIRIAPKSLIDEIIRSKNPKYYPLIYYSKIGREFLNKKYIVPIEKADEDLCSSIENFVHGIENTKLELTKDQNPEMVNALTKVFLDTCKRILEYYLRGLLFPDKLYDNDKKAKDFIILLQTLVSLIDVKTLALMFGKDEKGIRIPKSIIKDLRVMRLSSKRLEYLINAYMSKNFDI